MAVLRWFLGALAVVVLFADPASGYNVAFDYYVYATHSDEIPIMDDQTRLNEAYAEGSYTKTGAVGNYGSATYNVDLFDWSVSATAYSHGEQVSLYNFGLGNGRVEAATFYDRVTFTAPAGTHAEGLQVTMTGLAQGTISSTVGAGASGRCLAYLGSEIWDTGLLETGTDETRTIVVDESWSLVLEIVAPGTTLLQPVESIHQVRLGFYNGIASSVQFNPGTGSVTGDGDVDFLDGLRITSFTASPGVTWESESGAFSDGLSDVPGPAATASPVLHQNHPNPFNPATVIRFELAEAAQVDLAVYDVAGNLVRKLLVGDHRDVGSGEVHWNGRDDADRSVAAGVYFYRLRADGAELARRMVLVR